MQGDSYLRSLIVDGVSDIHFKVGSAPLRRIFGTLKPVEGSDKLSPKDTESLAMHLLGPSLWEKFVEDSEVDTSYSLAGFSRFRVCVFRQRGTISLALRIIPFRSPTMSELRLPEAVKEIALAPRGLVLVTGVTGSGKSSTLAAMTDYINETKRSHIITLEDPIEFLHQDKLSAINQREIGTDTPDFARALRSALRQDPDVILVGELRDTETMTTALRAAETGHLVLSTIHTTDAKETVGRYIDMFPPYQQKQIRLQLAANLRAVISQRLLERADKRGRILAAEVMVTSATIREQILAPDKFGGLIQTIERGRDRYGMQTFDQAIMELLAQKLVTEEEGIRHATSPNDLRVKLSLK